MNPVLIDGKPEITRSTAFLVSPCHILTARHSVFGESTPNTEGFDMKFTVGDDGAGNPIYRDIKATPMMWGPDMGSGNDWALMQVHPCAGANESIGWMNIENIKANQAVTMAGFPADKEGSKLWTSGKCQIRGLGQNNDILHDCASRPGSSGSPILFTAADGTPSVVGLHGGDSHASNGVIAKWDGAHSNVGISLDSVHGKIQAELQRAFNLYASKSNNKPNPQIVMAQQYRNTQVTQNGI